MLTEGIDFKCVDRSGKPLSICYGVGIANHQLFQRLQTLLNQFAFAVPPEAGTVQLGDMSWKGGGWSIAVDGFIGSATEALSMGAALVAQALGFSSDLIDRATRYNGKEFVAANASELITALTEPASAFERLRREQGRRQAAAASSATARSASRTSGISSGAPRGCYGSRVRTFGRGTYGNATVGAAPDKLVAGHLRAVEFLRRSPILGVQDKGTAGNEVQRRLTEVWRELISRRGAPPGSPGIPRLTASEVIALITRLIDAVRVGLAPDAALDPEGYVVSKELEPVVPRVVKQQKKFEQLMQTGFAPPGVVTLPSDFEPTELGKNIQKALEQRFIAQTADPTKYDSTTGIIAAIKIAEQMDRQGITFKDPSLVDELKRSAQNLPGRVRDAASGTWDVVKYGVLGVAAIGGIVVLSTLTRRRSA